MSAQQVERLTRPIGGARVAERTAAAAAFQELPLADKHRTPAATASPAVAVVDTDGGRLRIRERGLGGAAAAEEETRPGRQKGKQGRQDKAALLLTMASEVSASDPCPEIAETFVDPTRLLKWRREIHAVSAGVDGGVEAEQEAASGEEELSAPAQ